MMTTEISPDIHDPKYADFQMKRIIARRDEIRHEQQKEQAPPESGRKRDELLELPLAQRQQIQSEREDKPLAFARRHHASTNGS